MIKGIDVSSAQAGISFKAVKSAGYAWCVVKMGGYNVAPEYVAPHYREQVDGARAAGLKVGHYWLVGAGSAVQEADYFAANLYHLDKNHDILALDDERLDSNATFWADANVAAFFTELHKKTGVPYSRMWFYVGAYNASVNTWAKTRALGVKTWVASYGANDGGIYPADTGGRLPVDVQQYTSNEHIPGVGGQIDASYTNVSLASLFNLAPAPAPAPAVKPGRIVYTLSTGIPNAAFYKRLQWLGHLYGYTGAITGTMNVNAWKGVQAALQKHYGYTGPIDGAPGINTFKALQRYAAKYGYTGPIDGVLGVNSYKALAKALNTL